MDVLVEYLPNIVFACFTLHNFCEECNVEVSHTLVNKIIANENRMSTKLDLINSYTTSSSAKVIETITDYFKEHR